MQAIYNDKVIAEADKDDLISIDGNWYFPPDSLSKEYFKPSDTHTTCFWKGEASYYDVDDGSSSSRDGAWYYPKPMDGAPKKVGHDFTNYVAFSGDVKVSE